jgi:predicted TIM-barrel fold metal-dependent hydrolase
MHSTVIDCDVHHARRTDAELLEFLPAAWREYAVGPGRAGNVPLTVSDGYPNPHGFMRADSYAEDGAPPGSDLATMDAQLLTPLNVGRAVLTYGDDIHVSGHHNPYFATALAQALNDWTVARWLEADERLAGSILVAAQLPDRAAEEVRRMADTPRMVQVLLADNPTKSGFGHPIFHPIYAAAVETGRPVAIHAGANDWANPPSTGGATSNLYFETHSLWPQALMTHFVSLVAHGVFEKYPQLKILLIEGGAAWIAPLLWRMDTEYKGLRREIPWVRRLPSEYFREHVWVTTQPLELSPRREQLIDVLGGIDGADRLVFSSDYPHWDSDELEHVRGRLPREWEDNVFRGNAMRLYDWADADLPVELALGVGE